MEYNQNMPTRTYVKMRRRRSKRRWKGRGRRRNPRDATVGSRSRCHNKAATPSQSGLFRNTMWGQSAGEQSVRSDKMSQGQHRARLERHCPLVV